MFKDYQFFSNNLQDAARQILEAQGAQAKKENVEAVKPGPNEPMGQPLDEPAYDPDVQRGQFNTNDPPYDEENKGIVQPEDKLKTNQKIIDKILSKLGKPLGPPNENDGEATRMPKTKDAMDAAAFKKASEKRNSENVMFWENIKEKQRLIKQKDQEEATRQGMTLDNYYRMKARDKERAAEREKQKEQERPRFGIPMDELA